MYLWYKTCDEQLEGLRLNTCDILGRDRFKDQSRENLGQLNSNITASYGISASEVIA